MALRTSQAFQVDRQMSDEQETPRLVLKHAQSARTVELPGGVLEAQFEGERGYLIFTTEGHPQEEALFIHWLDRALHVEDGLEISADYTPGIFKNPTAALTEEGIVFSFFDDGKRWSVTVLKSPRWLRHKYPVKRKTPFWQRSRLLVQSGAAIIP
ncbi:hypothetical protein AVMA1855_05665 [Acidovorax sp. SUPP1855]|uniref:hypothetical protein n=1 Tax=Acidovorax sp. SUPP1855 TaxID=431774 RepID=UPI0023DE5F16|nr:hypothetical protein [Acidovorax sp. SUPP1855]GKS83607.1 hypothetical protein AVMA1855_05665 [Acidovorax sp. SUPP1855]